MKKMIGILFIFFGVLILLGLFVNSNIGNRFTSSNQHESADLSGIKTIDVDSSSAYVHVIPSKRNDLEAALNGHKFRMTVNHEGDTIKVDIKHKWLNFLPFWKPSTLNIYIPEDYNKNMDLSTGSGNVKFNGETMNLNRLKLNVHSGNIVLKNLHISHLYNNTLSGNFNGDHLITKTTSLDIKSGNINLSSFTGELNGKVLSGHLSAQFDQLNDPIHLDVKSGDATLKFPKNADFTLNAHTISGKVNCDIPLQKAKVNDDNIVNGSYGTGKYPVKLNVTSGKINIY
ncbi:DUF4097 family beta strand repeat-containing protein [Scopulibacillus cellulosilyticus]|uniref:DUF4097 family beta strand repeat-containing protein n=1 Tax=Scopulibacillus cellulosilyticus TaxID=2665665 RepID=A0ABW2Q194_9BACL